MSGQFPSGYNNPVGSGVHRGNFGNQMVNMNMGLNQMGMMGYNQIGMMSQQQQQSPGSAIGMVGGPQVMGHAAAAGTTSVQQQQQMAAMQSPSHVIQQQQTQQMQTPTVSVPVGGVVGPGNIVVGGSMMGQQQQASMVPSAPQPPQQQKEINMVNLCRLGQETVQDITSRFQEIFSALKTIQSQPSSGNQTASTEKKVQEYFRTIRLLFKRLRLIYEKSNDGCAQGMDFITHVESLIPYKDDLEQRTEPTQCEEYKKALQENRELIDTVMLKNKQLREIIDRSRIIIWEINTMLSMRRS